MVKSARPCRGRTAVRPYFSPLGLAPKERQSLAQGVPGVLPEVLRVAPLGASIPFRLERGRYTIFYLVGGQKPR